MLIVGEDVVLDIKSLSNANPAAMLRVTQWLDSNFEELNSMLNHLDPDPSDHNFSIRFHHRRGFVAALDSVRNLLSNPDDAIPKSDETQPDKEDSF